MEGSVSSGAGSSSLELLLDLRMVDNKGIHYCSFGCKGIMMIGGRNGHISCMRRLSLTAELWTSRIEGAENCLLKLGGGVLKLD